MKKMWDVEELLRRGFLFNKCGWRRVEMQVVVSRGDRHFLTFRSVSHVSHVALSPFADDEGSRADCCPALQPESARQEVTEANTEKLLIRLARVYLAFAHANSRSPTFTIAEDDNYIHPHTNSHSQTDTMSASELASSYAALILADDGVDITVRDLVVCMRWWYRN